MLLWGIVIVFGAVLVMKLVPAYVEFFTIKKVLVDIGQDPEINTMSNAAIREKFSKRSQIDDIHSVKPADLDISRDKGATIISADYPFQTKLVGNISLLVDFHATSDSAESRARQRGQLVE
ncbi:MAG TPA: DUF4845 domain-containing protein [Thiobacillaceae bacterium]|nr:DUF4845 domain-containing protein [Thiobacillaceae bacterium]